MPRHTQPADAIRPTPPFRPCRIIRQAGLPHPITCQLPTYSQSVNDEFYSPTHFDPGNSASKTCLLLNYDPSARPLHFCGQVLTEPKITSDRDCGKSSTPNRRSLKAFDHPSFLLILVLEEKHHVISARDINSITILQ